MSGDAEVMLPMAVDSNVETFVESAETNVDKLDCLNATNEDPSQSHSLTDDAHQNFSIGVETSPIPDDVQPASQSSNVVTKVEDDETNFSQVADLVRELIEIGCRNAEEPPVSESVLDASIVIANHDSFSLQRNYIPEHLLPSSDSSSGNEDSSSSSSSGEDSSSEEDGSEDSLSSDSSSDDSDDSSFETILRNGPSNRRRRPVRTKGEFGVEDLPPIQDLKISVNRSDVKHVGSVLSIVECLVVVQSQMNMPALNLDTVLFFEDGEPLGQIFDVFGPVIRPLYSVRFNTIEDIKAKNVVIGSFVYYAPAKTEFTTFVFAEQLRRMKGSDASWEDNNEPPENHLDYSDDEQEKLAKARMKNRHRKSHEEDIGLSGDGHDVDDCNGAEKQPSQQRMKRWSRRGRGRRGFHNSTNPQAVALSTEAQMKPDLHQPNVIPPPVYDRYWHERPLRPPTVFNERPQPQNPFYVRQASMIPPLPMFAGQFSRPPPPLPPPPQTVFGQQWPRMSPWRSPAAPLTPIASLFRGQPRAANAELSNSTSSGNANQSPSPASSVLPNPFRNPGNVLDVGSQGCPAADDNETRMTPRFPPLGFVPRF